MLFTFICAHDELSDQGYTSLQKLDEIESGQMVGDDVLGSNNNMLLLWYLLWKKGLLLELLL